MQKFVIALVCAVALFLSACSKSVTGPVTLKCEVEGEPGEVIIVSYVSGQPQEYHYPEVENGKFEFSLDGIKDFTDLIVSVGEIEFGARINVNDTLRMSFTVNESGKDVEVRYSGSTEKESRIWTDFYDTYLYWNKYNLKLNRDTSISYDQSIELLEKSDSVFRMEHEADMNKYYESRASLAYGLLKSILMEQKAYETGVDPTDWPEYVALMDRVDPNDPDAVTFPLVNRWVNLKVKEFEGSEVSKDIAFMQRYGKTISNSSVRGMIAHNMIAALDAQIQPDSPDQYEAFFNELEKFVPEHPEAIETGRRKIESFVRSLPGTPVPDAMLETPNGELVNLSSLFGKVLFIDIWASWCGPCRQQIPYLRSLVENYADDGRICFISISTDSEKDDWLEALQDENPSWPQYIFEKESNNDFCGQLNIDTIPRFLLIDKDGSIIDADCEFPSSENIGVIIQDAISRQL